VENLKPGSLFHFDPKDIPWECRFCPVVQNKIQCHIDWNHRILLKVPSIILFAGGLDLSTATATTTLSRPSTRPMRTTTPAAMGAVTPAVTTAAVVTWARQGAYVEFETTGKIVGGSFLTPNGNLFWASHYDAESFSAV
jgi:hypothetical protein